MDNELLDMIQKQSFQYFLNECNPDTGLIRNQAHNFKVDSSSDMYNISNPASVGFGLASICVADSRGWISKEEAYTRVLAILKAFRDGPVKNVNGFYYRYNDMITGERALVKLLSELSSLDTALFLYGALFAGHYYEDTEVESVAEELYRRTDWKWMSDENAFVNFCWYPPDDPRSGFHHDYWRRFGESVLVNLLAIGSPTYPIEPLAWKVMMRPKVSYHQYTLTTTEPIPNALYIHQWPNIWVDFRNKNDGFLNYFENARIATLANRQYCIDHMTGMEKPSFKTYNENCWGISEWDDLKEYRSYASLGGEVKYNGTIRPWAVLSSMMLTPQESIDAIDYIYKNYKHYIWGKYGFCESFSIDTDTWSREVFGRHIGSSILAIENFRTELVWNTFMRIPHIQNALHKCGFRAETKGASDMSTKSIR